MKPPPPPGDVAKTESKTRLRLVVMAETGGIVGGLTRIHCVQPAIGCRVSSFIEGSSLGLLLGSFLFMGDRLIGAKSHVQVSIYIRTKLTTLKSTNMEFICSWSELGSRLN